MFQREMKQIIGSVVKSVGILIELRDNFATREDDPLFLEAISTVEEVNIPDIRAQANYALLLFSTAKVRVASVKSINFTTQLNNIMMRCYIFIK